MSLTEPDDAAHKVPAKAMTVTHRDSSITTDFRRDGFAFARSMFSPDEAAAMKAEIRSILADHSHVGGVYVGLAAVSQLFRRAARNSAMLDALEHVIGPDIEFLSDKVALKSGDVQFGSPWHQDWPYWKGAHKVSVWIALDPADRSNGCLRLLPGSHHHPVEHSGVAPEGEGFGNRLAPGSVDESRAVDAVCAVGDAVLFHDLTLHASYPNRSGNDRYSLISTYRSAAEPDIRYDWAVAAEVVRGRAQA
ncbi:MAG: phytanoyl-CoA dioxygenase family protein [Armatimonadetes bacterium]|nr:phytanoyl-CoA dioxygenase family protein [Armatimonadota bacterium]MDE2205665.1 phytanoyl-CoA dioxygenase family protein [Armatimonadota bacterium]